MAIRISDPPLYLPVDDPIWIDWVSQLISALDLLAETYGEGGVDDADVAADFYINGMLRYSRTIANDTFVQNSADLRIVSGWAAGNGYGGLRLQVGPSTGSTLAVINFYYNYSGTIQNWPDCQTFVPPSNYYKYVRNAFTWYTGTAEQR